MNLLIRWIKLFFFIFICLFQKTCYKFCESSFMSLGSPCIYLSNDISMLSHRIHYNRLLFRRRYGTLNMVGSQIKINFEYFGFVRIIYMWFMAFIYYFIFGLKKKEIWPRMLSNYVKMWSGDNWYIEYHTLVYFLPNFAHAKNIMSDKT